MKLSQIFCKRKKKALREHNIKTLSDPGSQEKDFHLTHPPLLIFLALRINPKTKGKKTKTKDKRHRIGGEDFKEIYWNCYSQRIGKGQGTDERSNC